MLSVLKAVLSYPIRRHTRGDFAAECHQIVNKCHADQIFFAPDFTFSCRKIELLSATQQPLNLSGLDQGGDIHGQRHAHVNQRPTPD
jgi:hypothetical protein